MLITLLCLHARPCDWRFDTDTGAQSITGLPDCEQSAYVHLPDTNDGTVNHDHWSWSEIRLFVYGDENIPFGFAGFFPIVDSTVSGEVDTTTATACLCTITLTTMSLATQHHTQSSARHHRS